jgi:chromate transporter
MSSALGEIARLFLKLGTIGFGGPATHLALMEDEVVQRRGWLTRQHFIDLIGATNLIPGPNSTEMAIHIGFVRGGVAGLLVAGVCFIAPAVLITTCLAWLYVEYGQLPQIMPMIAGIKPAVLAIIFTACWRLGRKAINGPIVALIALIVGSASIFGVAEIPALLGGAFLGTVCLLVSRRRPSNRNQTPVAGAVFLGTGFSKSATNGSGWLSAPLATAGALTGAATLTELGLFFLKIGAVLYGTGYVLIAYLQGGLVDRLGWLTQDQLLDAVAIGQFTPGPILSTATFIGYVVMSEQGGHAAGLAGAVTATAGVFLPSFVLVAVTNPLVPRLRKFRGTASFLDAVNAASMGLMAAVVIELAMAIFFPTGDWNAANFPSLLIALTATTVAQRWKPSAVWIVIGGALAGLAFWLIGWPAGV